MFKCVPSAEGVAEALGGLEFRAMGYLYTNEGEGLLIWMWKRVPLDGVESRSTSPKREQQTLVSFSSSLIEEGSTVTIVWMWLNEAGSLAGPHTGYA